MWNQRHLSNILFWVASLFIFSGTIAFAENAPAQYEKNRTSFYRDLYDQGIHGEMTQYLHMDRLYRKITGKKVPAVNVNKFDEVPDSAFFTNRHAREKLSLKQLEEGFRQTAGPDLAKGLLVQKIYSEGKHLIFLAKDGKGDDYLLKFDAAETPELMTSSDVVTGRFYYALGYNVPQSDAISFERSQLTIAPDATVIGESGFEAKLTPERLEESLMFLSMDAQSRYRASASKVLSGQDEGWFGFSGTRKQDPADTIPHENRRELRALQVFASWLNDIEIRTGSTEDRFVSENGKQYLKHSLVNFPASFGSGDGGVKPPEFSHEYILDYGTVLKSILTLGLWEKPWEKRWREAGEKVNQNPAVGYFDNAYFDPGQFKPGLPNQAFKQLTRADGFWAAKIIMSFSDDDVKAMVKAGRYTNPEDAQTITKILTARRDLIGQYWFGMANPLDDFDYQSGVLTFKDLGTTYGFWNAKDTTYTAEILGQDSKVLGTLQAKEPSFDLKKQFSSSEGVTLRIRTERASKSLVSPTVLVKVGASGIQGITHEE